MTVLHIAPEMTFQSRLSAIPGVEYVCGDLDTPTTMTLDITNLPFESDHFDLILCNHVLRACARRQQRDNGIASSFKPDGRAILQTPFNVSLNQTVEYPSIADP